MKISGIQNSQIVTQKPTSFNGLRVDINPAELALKPVATQFKKIKNIMVNNKFDKKRYVDVILTRENGNFYGIISSKTQGIPMNPAYRQPIKASKKSANEFKNWLNDWDFLYSPKGIKQKNEIINAAVEAMKRHKEQRELVKTFLG